MRSRWSYFYLAFYLITTFALLYLSQDLSKVIVSLMNIVVVLTPLIGILLGTMYFYNSREFVELLLAQPVKRVAVFFGQYLGLTLSLSLSLLLGLGVPFVVFGVFGSAQTSDFMMLLIVGVLLTLVFTAIAYLIAAKFENKLKGFGVAIVIWLIMAVLYDGLLLLLMIVFESYPLEQGVLAAVMLNPIDLSRILIMLQLDISALFGYTGAVFDKFFGTSQGMFLALSALVLWVVLPIRWFLKIIRIKDF